MQKSPVSAPSDLSLKTGVRQLTAPTGWVALVLEGTYLVLDPHLQPYQNAVTELLRLFPCFDAPVQEVILQFDRLSPERDVPIFQQNARQWFSKIGMGVWPHREPPTLWSREEFIDAEPGTLRPMMYKLFHLEQDPVISRSAWNTMLGSGTLMRLAISSLATFRQRSYGFHHPRIQERSLQSYSIYTSLLEGAAIQNVTVEQLDLWLPAVDGYLRESSEDGGLFLLARQSQPDWWQNLRHSKHASTFPWIFL